MSENTKLNNDDLIELLETATAVTEQETDTVDGSPDDPIAEDAEAYILPEQSGRSVNHSLTLMTLTEVAVAILAFTLAFAVASVWQR